MTSFNDGIEAAAKRLREISHEGLKSSWWREQFESAARSVEALKRPEPSEDDVLKVAQAIRQQIPDAEPIAIEAAARAALKAMEGE